MVAELANAASRSPSPAHRRPLFAAWGLLLHLLLWLFRLELKPIPVPGWVGTRHANPSQDYIIDAVASCHGMQAWHLNHLTMF